MTRRLGTRTMTALALIMAITLPVLLAACQVPAEIDPWGDALQPGSRSVRGLTSEHARSHPHEIHVSADGSKAFIAMPGTISRPDNRVAVVDLEQGRLLTHLRVGERPLAFAADPQDRGRLLVAHPYSPSISALNTTNQALVQILRAPYYIESLAFSPDGARLLGVDRAMDRLVVWDVERNGGRLALEETGSIPTGPNPEHVVWVPPPAGALWDAGRIAAVTDRHGASVTLIDLETRVTQRVPTGGAPLHISARDGLVFVAGLGPGDGKPGPDGSGQGGTAALENSLLVLDLRRGPDQLAATPVPQARYLSDTAPATTTPPAMRILGGALPVRLTWDTIPIPGHLMPANGTAQLWVTYHATDQVQVLHYTAPAPGAALDAGLLRPPSGAHGERLSHHGAERPLGPGLLTDTTHGIYETPPGPRAVARSNDLLLVVAELPERLLMLNLADCPGATAPTAPCTTRTVDLVEDPIPYPSGAFERGERLFVSALPSADQDRSCASCHIGGLATGGTWALPHRDYEPVRIPRLDQVAEAAPWLLDGSVERPEEYLRAAGGDLLRADPDDPMNLAAHAPQNETDAGFHANDTTAYGTFPGASTRLGLVDADADDPLEWMRLAFGFAIGEIRLLPQPPETMRPDGRNLARGMTLWDSVSADCASCHIGGERARLILTDRLDDDDRYNTDIVKAPHLAGIWDRQGTAMFHDGRARTILETILPPGHTCLEAGAEGQAPLWHSGASDRTCEVIHDLAAAVLVLDARR